MPESAAPQSRPHLPGRRSALKALVASMAAGLGLPARAWARVTGPGHPTPRPGITAAKVLPADRIHNVEARPFFDLVREIPEVIDGIRCHCGCAELEGSYSLLSCYEGHGMAQHCVICQGQARLAHRLHREGWSLNGIRASIDAAFIEPA